MKKVKIMILTARHCYSPKAEIRGEHGVWLIFVEGRFSCTLYDLVICLGSLVSCCVKLLTGLRSSALLSYSRFSEVTTKVVFGIRGVTLAGA